MTVFDRDQQAVDLLYRIYRSVRLTVPVSRSAPLTMERAVERQALLIYAVEDAGVATPRLRALIRVGSEAAVLCCERRTGTTLARLPASPTDDQLASVWAAVLRLHEHRVTHRALTADRILLTGPECTDVVLLDPGNGDVAATELQRRLDLAQLLAELALLVGPDRAVDVAMEQVGPELPGHRAAAPAGGAAPLDQGRAAAAQGRAARAAQAADRRRAGRRDPAGAAGAVPAAHHHHAGRRRGGGRHRGRPAQQGKASASLLAHAELGLGAGRAGAVGGDLHRRDLVADRLRAGAAQLGPDVPGPGRGHVRGPGHAGRGRAASR